MGSGNRHRWCYTVRVLVPLAAVSTSASTPTITSAGRVLGFAPTLRPLPTGITSSDRSIVGVGRASATPTCSPRRSASATTPSMARGHRGVLLTAIGSVLRRRGRGGNTSGVISDDSVSDPRLGRPRSGRTSSAAGVSSSASVASGSVGTQQVGEGSSKFSWRRGEWANAHGSRNAPATIGNSFTGEESRGRGRDPLSATREPFRSFTDLKDLDGDNVKEEERARGGEAADGAVTELTEGQGVAVGDRNGSRRGGIRIGADLVDDVKRRSKHYVSDWTDGFNRKSIPAILFLYFACLLPSVAFGGIASQVTRGNLGVIEYVVSCGVGGMAYSILGGQPMTFIGPTGLTLAFMTSLHSFTSVAGLPFIVVYSWVGIWTSIFLSTLALIGASNLIGYATQFTDDVFNALLSVNFIYEAARSLLRNFNPAVANFSQAGALLSLNVAVATYMGCRKTSAALSSRIFNSKFREFVSDFGPLLVIGVMSSLCALPSWKSLLSFLEVPSTFMLCNGRSWVVPIFAVDMKVRLACALPALLLTSLFFLDQNISARVVNSPRHKMVKGAAYHQDMMVLGVITGALSIVGLPWQCAATVQSLNHVRQMATLKSADSAAVGGADSDKAAEEIESIYETRLTGFCVHALVLASLALLPQLGKIPMAVVSGIFLYLGRKVMSGNGFLIRLKEVIADRDLLSASSDIRKVGFATACKYTAVQAGMLSLLWTLKSFGRTALFFPSVIGLLIVVRIFALPKMFSAKDLSALDAAVG